MFNNIKISIIIFVLVVVAVFGTSENDYETAFNEFKEKYNKKYVTCSLDECDYGEEETRYNIFKSNYDFVQNWDATGSGFQIAINQFADLTVDEWKKLYTGLQQDSSIQEDSKKSNSKRNIEYYHRKHYGDDDDKKIHCSWDWRREGAVTPVKNQEQCGSCWAFAAVGAIESAYYLKTGELVTLSEQNLVDCSTPQGNGGCSGGWPYKAFQYVMENYGIDTNESYPYTATDGWCQFDSSNVGATVHSYQAVTSGDETALLFAVSLQPVTVAINVQQSFQFYYRGVYYEPNCNPYWLDHAVLAVGWGWERGDYWLIKNSWGTSWGDQGYIKMARNRDNNCGIATAASYPIII